MSRINLLFILVVFISLIFNFPLAVGFGSLVLVFHILKNRKIGVSLISSKPLILLIFYWLLAGSIYLLNGVPLDAYAKYLILPSFILFVGLLNITSMNKMLLPLMILSILMVFLFTFRDVNNNLTFAISEFRILFKGQAIFHESVDKSRSFFLQNNTNISAYFISALSLNLLLYQTRKSKIYLLISIGMFFLIFILNTRSAYMACMLIVLVYVLVNSQNIIMSSLKIGFLLIIAGLIIYIFLTLYYDLFSIQAGRLSNKGVQGGLELRYQLYWLSAFAFFFRNPWGYGHNFFYDMNGASTHSEYIGQLISTGFLGFAIYYWFIFYTLYKTFTMYRSGPKESRIISGTTCFMLITYLTIGLTEQLTISARIWMLYLFFFIGMFYSNIYRRKSFNTSST